MKTTGQAFVEDFTRDIPRGLSSRYLSEQAIPQARWQSPDVILDRRALAYNPDNPGRKILVGAFGDKLIGMTIAMSDRGGKVAQRKIGNAHRQSAPLQGQCFSDRPQSRTRQHHG
jgi:hypothetical protein